MFKTRYWFFHQAPEWAEGDVCHMCRVKFSTFQRQVNNSWSQFGLFIVKIRKP